MINSTSLFYLRVSGVLSNELTISRQSLYSSWDMWSLLSGVINSCLRLRDVKQMNSRSSSSREDISEQENMQHKSNSFKEPMAIHAASHADFRLRALTPIFQRERAWGINLEYLYNLIKKSLKLLFQLQTPMMPDYLILKLIIKILYYFLRLYIKSKKPDKPEAPKLQLNAREEALLFWNPSHWRRPQGKILSVTELTSSTQTHTHTLLYRCSIAYG